MPGVACENQQNTMEFIRPKDCFSVNTFLLQIQWGACGLVMTGNAVIFLTIFGFFVVFGGGDDFSWEQW